MATCKRLFLLILIACIGCSKKKFLDADPFINSSTISSLKDCRNLLNNQVLLAETPLLGELTSDDYYMKDSLLLSITDYKKNAVTWEVDIFKGQTKIPDYNIPYQQVNLANEILAALPLIPVDEKEKEERMNIEGTALFIRAYAFYNLLQLFAKPYDNANAASDPGIALPLKPNASMKFVRASMEESYDQVINDLNNARPLLTATVQYNKPSKGAVDALLARVFLSMRNYDEAALAADRCLAQYNKLMDFYNLNPTAIYPMNGHTEEIIYYSNILADNTVIRARISSAIIIASDLYASYAANDLRKEVYYELNNDMLPYYYASYTGKIFAFSGLATDEMYLIRAECRARKNDVTGAMEDLNTLLLNRFKRGTYVPQTATSWESALQLILAERRKELVFRGIRFSDLRRLNKEGAGIWISRVANSQIHQLPPNDLRYTLPIPEDALANSNIVQNPRQ